MNIFSYMYSILIGYFIYNASWFNKYFLLYVFDFNLLFYL